MEGAVSLPLALIIVGLPLVLLSVGWLVDYVTVTIGRIMVTRHRCNYAVNYRPGWHTRCELAHGHAQLLHRGRDETGESLVWTVGDPREYVSLHDGYAAWEVPSGAAL